MFLESFEVSDFQRVLKNQNLSEFGFVVYLASLVYKLDSEFHLVALFQRVQYFHKPSEFGFLAGQRVWKVELLSEFLKPDNSSEFQTPLEASEFGINPNPSEFGLVFVFQRVLKLGFSNPGEF